MGRYLSRFSLVRSVVLFTLLAPRTGPVDGGEEGG